MAKKKAVTQKPFLSEKVFIAIIFFALLVTSFNITIFVHKHLATKVLGAQSETDDHAELYSLFEEKSFWEDVLEKHPTYRDAYLELADIESRLGNQRKAQELLNSARGVDPNYKDFN